MVEFGEKLHIFVKGADNIDRCLSCNVTKEKKGKIIPLSDPCTGSIKGKSHKRVVDAAIQDIFAFSSINVLNVTRIGYDEFIAKK